MPKENEGKSVVYKLLQPGDVEGRSSTTVAYFAQESDADLLGRTGYKDHSMGCRGEHGKVEEVVIYATLDDFLADHPKAREDVEATITRERALAKLSDEERAALGLPTREGT